MSVSDFIQQLRHLVLEHPWAAQEEVMIHCGPHRFMPVITIHENSHGTKVVIEGKE